MVFITVQLVHAAELSEQQQQKLSSYIDKLILKNLQSKGIKPNPPASDEVFLRRIYLDITGRIPTLQEYKNYMKSNEATRRDDEIDKLFESKGYISHNFNYWVEALRAKTMHKKTFFENYHLWIKKSIANNKPYDKFVYELISSEGFLHEIDNGSTGYYARDVGMPFDNLANTMQLFNATSLVCAQCHDHPYNEYTQLDFYKLAAFNNGTTFSSKVDNGKKKKKDKTAEKVFKTREQKKIQRATNGAVIHTGRGKINLPDDYNYEDHQPNELVLADVPYGPKVSINYDSSNGTKEQTFKYRKLTASTQQKQVNSRKYFAEWLTSKDNPMFTKTIVNRLWDRLFGTPLAGKILDMNEKSMGTNPELTKFMIKMMKHINYDTKMFMKIITKSNFYQRSATQEKVTLKKYHFQGPVMKRLRAEEIWDSLLSTRLEDPDSTVQIPDYTMGNLMNKYLTTQGQNELKSFIEDPKAAKAKITKMYPGKTIAKWLGRPGDLRASDLYQPVKPGSLIQLFGGSTRQLIDESIQEANIPQALTLMNDSKLAFSKTFLAKKLSKIKSPADKINSLYGAVLTRKPTSIEMTTIKKYLDNGMKMESLYWALINTHEFIIRN